MKIFVYKVRSPNVANIQTIAVAAENSTVAQNGLEQQLGSDIQHWFQGTIDMFMQVQGNLVIEGNAKVLSEPPPPNESE